MKILVIAIPGIGNTLLTVPLIKVIKKKFPNSKIDLLVGVKGSKTIMQNCPYINKIYFINKNIQRNLLVNLRTLQILRKNKYDFSLNTFPASQTHYNILSFLIGAKKKVTHNYGNKISSLGNFKVNIKKIHDVEQNLNLLEVFNIKNKSKVELELWLNKKDEGFSKEFLKDFKKNKIIGIHPGTSIERGMIKKRWEAKKFTKLIEKILERKNNRIMIFLGPEDKGLEKIYLDINKEEREKIKLVKNIDFMKACSLISKCNFFISNDSGLMHIAAAAKVPTAGIFLSTDYRRTAPYGKNNLVIKNNETYKLFRQSIEELEGIKTNWETKKIKELKVNQVLSKIKPKIR